MLTAACTTLGPDYAEPEAEWLQEWQTDLYGEVGDAEKRSSLDVQNWWLRFDDPVLTALIEDARVENPTLQIAGLAILQSRAQLGIADANRYPQSQQATGSAQIIDRQESGGAANNDDTFRSYQAGVGLGWELDFWGRFQRGIESADAAYLGSITNYQDVQLLLCAQVASLYYAYRTDLGRIDIANKNAAIQKRSLEITEQLFEGGQQSELDLQQAKSQYLATLATVPTLEISLAQNRNALAALLRRPPGELAELGGATGDLPDLPDLGVNRVPARLVARRPDVRTAAWQVATQSAQIGIAEADYYPAITLLGSVGWAANSVDGSPDTTTSAGGPSFTWNIFDYGRIANNIRLQDARLQQSIENFQNTVLQAAQEVDSAAISVVKTRELKGTLSASVQAAERSLELANTLYVEGYADFNRVLDAQRSLFTQSTNKLVNQGNHIAAIIEFYRSLGGGWSDPTIEGIIPESTREQMRERSDWGDLLDAPLPVPPPQGPTTPGSSR
jgi:NodT family efflux transporter outer membrane factor (OMF) lipoprotein